MTNNQYIRQPNGVILNKNVDELDKYLEQRRTIQNRNAQKEEHKTTTELLQQLLVEVAEIKQLLLDKKE